MKELKEIEISKRTETKTFKAKIKATKLRYLKKVCQHRETIKDEFEGHYKTALYVYLPKLTPKHPRPKIMLTMTNGGGTITIRTNKPEKIKEMLTNTTNYLNSNSFIENWERLNTIADQISNNTILVIDDKFIDRKQFEKFVLQD